MCYFSFTMSNYCPNFTLYSLKPNHDKDNIWLLNGFQKYIQLMLWILHLFLSYSNFFLHFFINLLLIHHTSSYMNGILLICHPNHHSLLLFNCTWRITYILSSTRGFNSSSTSHLTCLASIGNGWRSCAWTVWMIRSLNFV